MVHVALCDHRICGESIARIFVTRIYICTSSSKFNPGYKNYYTDLNVLKVLAMQPDGSCDDREGTGRPWPTMPIWLLACCRVAASLSSSFTFLFFFPVAVKLTLGPTMFSVSLASKTDYRLYRRLKLTSTKSDSRDNWKLYVAHCPPKPEWGEFLPCHLYTEVTKLYVLTRT